jgi:hypothetical protein
VAAIVQPNFAQVAPSANEPLSLSVFGGANGTLTGLASGHNLGVTAGGDLMLHPIRWFTPAVEVRGTYPLVKGGVDGEKNILAGFRASRNYGRIMPYADILLGGGAIDYVHGYANPAGTIEYTRTSSFVLSPGVGADLSIAAHLAFKVDAQLERYDTPVTTSGRIYAEAGTIGVVYRFGPGRFRRW